uniref:NADH dehydrogenase subunit 6 n=1 Tax=Homotoma ficus TaxID=2218120 RepID=A0A344A2F4_9HEMI|nr:NADH dehydrogenase subunit 6 [Homotoma ficus]AWU48945.1 NADH dehydrogenase subunit 6 [Homotoma ficus]
MLLYSMLMNLVVSSFMLYSSHPLVMSILLLMQTIIISISTRIMCNSSWMSYTMFMIMAGGMMIIFLYTTSICSNQQFSKLEVKMPILYTLVTSPLIIMQHSIFFKLENISLINLYSKEFFKMFLPMNFYSSMFVFSFLMLTLIITINVLNFNSGPMRKKY